MKDCNYPECAECEKLDCDMEEKDISALLKRRRWRNNPEIARIKQREYRKKVKESLPHCDECEDCIVVMGRDGKHLQRLCIEKLRLVEYKVANCPRWCERRTKTVDKKRETV